MSDANSKSYHKFSEESLNLVAFKYLCKGTVDDVRSQVDTHLANHQTAPCLQKFTICAEQTEERVHEVIEIIVARE
jgi:hypothetical protein